MFSKKVLTQHKDWIRQLYNACGRVGLACLQDFFKRHKLTIFQQNLATVVIDNARFSQVIKLADKSCGRAHYSYRLIGGLVN